MRISDWSSDVCSSDLLIGAAELVEARNRQEGFRIADIGRQRRRGIDGQAGALRRLVGLFERGTDILLRIAVAPDAEDQRRHLAEIDLILQIKAGLFQDLGVEEVEDGVGRIAIRSEEHTSELQSIMRISNAVFCLKKKKHN